MPTARELLEQADALMRRNRSALADDIPVLTESVPALPEAQVLRGRGAQARAGVPVPAVPVEGDTIPTLTERVETAPAPDAVAPAEEGEASDWLQREAGEPSVTGEIPDSVLIVPPPEDPSLPTEDFVFEDSRPHDQALHSARGAPAPEVAAEEIDLLPPLDPEAAEYAFDEEFAPRPPDSARDEPIADREVTVSVVDAAPAALGTPPAVNEALEEVAATAAHADAPDVAPSPAVPDDNRWEGVAEEIRMQVLQRIDMFTDTGLREQLALRLQPIVDRASADLVATINQHVGELLRAYVAEAIEREIEIWRRTH